MAETACVAEGGDSTQIGVVPMDIVATSTDEGGISSAQIKMSQFGESAETKENAETAAVQSQEMDLEKAEKEDSKLTELEKFWKAVRDNPSDFTGWTYLLQYVEQEDKIDAAREAFGEFLIKYPYCYGYWKKYADMEKKHKHLDKTEEVFERGVHSIPLSIDLWTHYINFIKTKYEKGDKTEYETRMRMLLERSITAAGTDFRSDKLWDIYIAWEKERNLKNVTALYDRLLSIPTQLYNYNFDNFKQHVNNSLPKDILTLDEFLRLRQEYVNEGGHKESEVPVTDGTEIPQELDVPPPGEEPPPGLDTEPGIENTELQKSTDEETKAIREKIISLREVKHSSTSEEVGKRWAYEEGIRRPYFHVKPLEKAQLKNWKEYLDFEIENGSVERIMVLFERCMIACALYEDLWLKYARYMETQNVNGARHVFRRACEIHLPKKANIHLAWAAFEERQGNYDGAQNILETLDETMPGLAMIHLRLLSLQRRQGNFGAVERLYKQYIEEAKSNDIRSFFSIKFARYMSKVLGNSERAENVLKEALEKDNINHKLMLQLIDLEYQKSTVDETKMVELFDQAIANSELPIEHRLAFSQRKMEFLEDFGGNVNRLLEIHDEHQKLLKELQSSRKRKLDQQTKDNKTTEEPDSKKTRTDTVSTNGTTDTTTNAQSQYQTTQDQSYNYGWPGYASGYNYTHPQGYGAGYHHTYPTH